MLNSEPTSVVRSANMAEPTGAMPAPLKAMSPPDETAAPVSRFRLFCAEAASGSANAKAAMAKV